MIAAENGVSVVTIYYWANQIKIKSMENADSLKLPRKTAIDRMQILTKYLELSENSRGEFLRKQQLYKATIDDWVTDPIKLFNGQLALISTVKNLENQLDQAKKEIQKKDAIIAEGAAIMLLKKKSSH
jgi:hypothetical protein